MESFFCSLASRSEKGLEEGPDLGLNRKFHVTLLSSEWQSLKGGLSTFNRELAIQLAKHPDLKVSVYLPQCSEDDKKVASSHNIELIEAEELHGFDPINWLTVAPANHVMDYVIGHGALLGRYAQIFKRQHQCKLWIQVVHTAPEELGKYKTYADAIFKGEEKHQAEVKLCEMADQVVVVGPKLNEAFSRYLCYCQKDQAVINLTPGIFSEFSHVKQSTEERKTFDVLVLGRGDSEDFQLKGYDIVAKAIAHLGLPFRLLFVGAPRGKEDEVTKQLLDFGINRSQLTVRCFNENREQLAKLFCEVDQATMPSRTEGFGLVALEALSASLPVLVSGNSGVGEALKKVPYGSQWVVDSESPKDWANSIRIVQGKDRELRLEEIKFLSEKYAAKFSWDGQCKLLVERMWKITPDGESVRKVRRSDSVNEADTIKAVEESSQTDHDTAAIIEQQRPLLNEIRLPRERDQQEENLKVQVSEMEQQVKKMEEQLREKDRELQNWERLASEREQHLTNFERQLQERELQEASLHELLREKGQQEQNSQKQLKQTQQQLKEKGKQEENLRRQLREMEQQLREKDENLKDRLREMEQQLKDLKGQFRGKQDETTNLQEQVTIQKRELMVKERQVDELEITLSTTQQALRERKRGLVTPDWVIPRDQIQLTDNLLGRGSWGSVVEGKYCGSSVAVKQIHELILCPHNQSLFQREMDIASRCRHPCLLQFIGATNDEGSLLFVTELMESSLRALLECRRLAAAEASIISLDVAGALNYLHEKKPFPIIHRDINSANVLLWRQGDQWRGKVSDYGSANFMQQTMTVCPGSPMYMAPETLTSNQTVKVDVYSFGVLLCEMCIAEMPDPERRDQQIAMVGNRRLRALIRRCVQSDPQARPNVEDCIEELKESI